MSSTAAAAAAARAIAKAGGASMVSLTMTTMIGSQLSQYNECKTVDCESPQPLRQAKLQSRVSTICTMCPNKISKRMIHWNRYSEPNAQHCKYILTPNPDCAFLHTDSILQTHT